MYSEEDINSAVAAGALSAEAAAGFRAHMTKVRELPRGSEENFRLINSFNDIFVAIGIVILLVAMGAVGQALAHSISPEPDDLRYLTDVAHPEADLSSYYATYQQEMLRYESLARSIAGILVAITAWPLAEFFTRKRRMALPSILLLLAFVGGTFFTGLGAGQALIVDGSERLGALMISIAALVAAGGAWLHYRRFMVPITVAAGSAAVAVTLIALLLAAIGPDNIETKIVLALVFIAGLAVFAFAMHWDISDRERVTRRSDVAFWLHLLAAPMIAHPVFTLIGITDNDGVGIAGAVGVLAVYIVFGFVALAIDRRALLVSALAYVLFALTFLFREFGAVELNFALTALVIGSALLSLSAFWQPIRRAVVSTLPDALQTKLPATEYPPLSATASAA